MSDLWFNVRFGSYHFQMSKYRVQLIHNEFQDTERHLDANWKWFRVYCWFGRER